MLPAKSPVSQFMAKTPEKKKKVDYEALSSPFMRMPGMKVEIARGLLDAGFRESYELSGRAHEVIIAEMLKRSPALATMPDLAPRLALAIYCAEAADPEPDKLKLGYWLDLVQKPKT